jgi:beta-glucanase (GH16 family)
MAALALLAAAVPLLGGCTRPSSPTPIRWDLVWADEFDGPAGASPDSARWRFDIGTDWGNAQLEYDTARPENVSLDGAGRLAITARKESYQNREYTSGRINTMGHFAQQGGRFEARIRLPAGRGIWPAFWLLGANFASVGWPACGEIDIMEYRGQETSVLHGSLHGPGYSGGSAVTSRYVLPGAAGFDQDFHVFAVEWSQDQITWIVDDTRFLTVRPADLPAGGAWVFDHPFFVILNVAVGGHFVGPPDASTAFPQTMLVDWVRVYRRGG